MKNKKDLLSPRAELFFGIIDRIFYYFTYLLPLIPLIWGVTELISIASDIQNTTVGLSQLLECAISFAIAMPLFAILGYVWRKIMKRSNPNIDGPFDNTL